MKLRLLAIFVVTASALWVMTWVLPAHGDTAVLKPSSPVSYPVDLVLIIDTSQSQAYDPPSGYAYTGDPTKGCNPRDVVSTTVPACIEACNNSLDHPCYPFQYAKDAAKALVDQLRPDIDRVAVNYYAQNANALEHMTFDLALIKTRIDQLRITNYNYLDPGAPCPFAYTPGERWICGTSNPGGAMWITRYEFYDIRPNTPDVNRNVLYIGSGIINRSDPNPGHPDPNVQSFGYCPPKNLADPSSRDDPPQCRDQRFSTHHPAPTPTAVPTDPLYDSKDYAVDGTDYLANWTYSPGDQRMTIYALGIGKELVCATGTTYDPGPPLVCANWDPPYEDLDSGLPNTGELFLRYMSAVSGDADPSTDPCAGVASGIDCGTYYFAPSETAAISDAINIATRIFGRPLPIADFTATLQSGIAPLSTQFIDHSAGNVVYYSWGFGDTVTSTEQSPTHTFAASGRFTITLRVDNATSYDILTRTNYITVYAPVSADFDANPLTGTYPLTVSFTNQSTGDYADQLWDFGDGVIATMMNPTHTFSTRGSFTVTLTASGLGGTSTITRASYITTYAPVHAAFAADPISGTLPLTVTFTNQSSGDYANVFWDFGDDITSTLFNPTHVYESIGSYTVTLNIIGLGGADSIARQNLIQVVKPEWKSYLPILLR